MARRGCVITKAVIEQEIRFDGESDFERFIHKLDYYEEPYKVVSKTYREGYLFVVIRKRYGEYPFLGDADPSTLSELYKDIRDTARGATRDEEGVLVITDLDKYQEWESESSRKSRY